MVGFGNRRGSGGLNTIPRRPRRGPTGIFYKKNTMNFDSIGASPSSRSYGHLLQEKYDEFRFYWRVALAYCNTVC